MTRAVRSQWHMVAVVTFLSACADGNSATAQSVTRGPYLQLGTPSSVVVRWRTSVASDSVVRYGDQPGNLLSSVTDPAVSTEHAVTLTGLSADTTYYYSVGTTSETLAGDDADHFFLTPPPAGTVKPLRLWIIGDSGTANANAAAVYNAYLAFTGSVHTDLWLMLGDNAYPDGTDGQYQSAVFNMYPALLRKSVAWPTLGNHDGHTADSATQTGPYYDIFTLPRNAEAGGIASGTEAYYSFDHGNVHFVCLESYETDRSSGGAMMTWLAQDLADTTRDWIIAFWHHPPYSKGSHNSDSEIELIEMRQNANPILEDGGVDLVFAGHSHSYERSFLLDGHYGNSGSLTASMVLDGGDGRESGDGAYSKPTAGLAPHEGAVYCVAGSSGQTSGGQLNHPAMFISLNVLGSVVLDVDGLRLDAIFLDDAGAVRDSFTLLKGTGTPPAAPSNLAATAFSDSRIDLSWSDDSTNESGFRLERSLDAASWAEIATTAPNVTAYSDSGLAASTTYHYRARAFNAFGDSAWSNVASATTEEEGTVVAIAGGEILVAGTVSGTYTDTHSSDDVYETITERESGGKPANRHSYLEHKWTFGVAAGGSVTLHVEAHHTANAEGDDFVFGWSTDDVSYTDVLTVTKTSDDDLDQTAALPPSLSGTVFVRVRDADQTSGNQQLDSVFVDRIAIRTTSSADTTPPAAPVNLVAAAVSPTQIDLDWDDNVEGDLASYNVYRDVAPGGPYTLVASGVPGSAFADGGLASGTTYYYVVTAVDLSGNESSISNEAVATTPSCSSATVHVASIVVSVENLGRGNKRGVAEVTVADDCGNLVPGATVSGTFTGDFNEGSSAVTDASGVAVLVTSTKRGSTSFTFCVDDITHASLVYEPLDDVETCDSNF